MTPQDQGVHAAEVDHVVKRFPLLWKVVIAAVGAAAVLVGFGANENARMNAKADKDKTEAQNAAMTARVAGLEQSINIAKTVQADEHAEVMRALSDLKGSLSAFDKKFDGWARMLAGQRR